MSNSMSDDRKNMTSTAICQMVDLLYVTATACQQSAAKLAAVEANRDELAKKLAEFQKFNAELLDEHSILSAKYQAKAQEVCEVHREKCQLSEQLAAANQRVAEAEKAKADVSSKYNVLISDLVSTHDTICDLENQVDKLRDQRAAANKRIDDLTKPMVGDYNCGHA